MKPVLIRINKKTVKPSPDIKYDYRIEFNFKIKIDYSESDMFFKNIGNPNIGLKIVTDAQFAKWLVDSLGLGKYLVFVWKKGRKGFCTFYFDCEKPNKFKQIRKKKSAEEEQMEKSLREIRKKKKQALDTEDIKEKESILKEIKEIKEDLGIDEEIIKIDKELDTKKVPLFKNTKPLYKAHEYQEYGNTVTGSDYDKRYDSTIW